MCNLNLRVFVNLPKQVPSPISFFLCTFVAFRIMVSLGGVSQSIKERNVSNLPHIINFIFVEPKTVFLIFSIDQIYNVSADTDEKGF